MYNFIVTCYINIIRNSKAFLPIYKYLSTSNSLTSLVFELIHEI